MVGGAVVGLYVDDTVAADVRPAKDVDLVFEITTHNALQELEKKLVNKGFKPSQVSKPCRQRGEKTNGK